MAPSGLGSGLGWSFPRHRSERAAGVGSAWLEGWLQCSEQPAAWMLLSDEWPAEAPAQRSQLPRPRLVRLWT